MKRFCKTCGAEIGEGTNVCSICGSVYGEYQENETTVLNSGPEYGANNQNNISNTAAQNQYVQRKVPTGQQQNHNPYSPSQSSMYGNNLSKPYGSPNINGSYKGRTTNNSKRSTSPGVSSPYTQGNTFNTNSHNKPPYQYSQTYGYNPVPTKKNKGIATGIIMGVVIGIVVIIAVIAIIVSATGSFSDTQSDSVDNFSSFDNSQDSEEIIVDYGTVSGTNYINPTVGISFDLPSSDWQFLSNQQIYDNSYDTITGANVYLDDTNHVCAENATETMHFDSYAVNSISATLIYTFFSKPSELAGDVDIDDYLINSVNADITSDSPYYATEDDVYSYVIADKEYRLCDTVVDINGVTFNSTFACRLEGDYVYGIVVMNSPEYDSNSILEYMDMFY